MLERRGDSWESEDKLLARAGNGYNGPSLEHSMPPQGGASRFANGLNAFFIRGGQSHKGVGRVGGLGGSLGDARDEKPQPRLPVTRKPNRLEQFVVLLAVLFEVQAEIQQRLP